jgi:lipid-A-disaccharide synthase-like uncharacterized protein
MMRSTLTAALLALVAMTATTQPAHAQEPATGLGPSVATSRAADVPQLQQQLGQCRAKIKDQQQEIVRLGAIAAKVGWPKTTAGQVWFLIGMIGEGVFFLRFVVQWWASERKKQTVVPMMFWHLSLVGTVIVLAYAVWAINWVFMLAYSLNIIIYVRNLAIAKRKPAMEAVMEKESE